MKGQAGPRASSLALVQVDAAAAKPAEGAAPEMDKNIPLAALQDLTDMKLSEVVFVFCAACCMLCSSLRTKL